MKKAAFITLLIVGMIRLSALSQSVSFELSTKTQVEVGEQFQVVLTLSAEGSNFSGPDFKGFDVLTGPMMSTSSSINIVNGRMDRSFNQTYTYIIMAQKAGEFTIGPASVTVNGNRLTSNKVTVRVTAGSANPGKAEVSGSNDDIFLKAVPDKRKVSLGEQVIITYKLYTKVPIANLTVTKISSFPGFWMKNLLDTNKEIKQSRQVINGSEYIVADIRQVALFPQKSGTLSIEPMELSCTAQIRVQSQRNMRDPFEAFFNDPFFNRGIQNVEKKLTSEAISIQVEPLPTAQRPADFKGAVGQFGFQSSIDRDQVKTGDAINLVYTINGTGNLELIDLPAPVFPSDFEVYEPKITTDIKTNAGGISGSRKVEYLIIPRVRGSFTIPPVHFVYFDPRTSTYNTLSSPEYPIHVEKGEGSSASEGMTASSQERITYLGSDIRHINLKKTSLKNKNDFFFASWLYFLIILGGSLLFALALLRHRKLDHLRSNQSLMRLRQATKVARKKLANAQAHLQKKDQDAFYLEMSQALWGYLSDKFTIPRSELSIENVKATLQQRKAPDELIDAFVDALNNCEFARFSPGDAGQKMDDLYRQGIELITKTEGTIR